MSGLSRSIDVCPIVDVDDPNGPAGFVDLRVSAQPAAGGVASLKANSSGGWLVVSVDVKLAYLETLLFMADRGRAPHYTELSKVLGVSVDRSRELQHAAAKAGIGSWFLEGADFVECWAPFSNIPTNHLITIDGEQRWYGQCGLESLAATWVVPDREVRIDSFCLDCAETVTVVQRNGEVLDIDPVGAVGHMNEPFSRGDWDDKASFL